MYRIIFITSMMIIFISCSGDKDGGKLTKDELAFKLALELADKVPEVHPDSNRTLVSTSDFSVSTADVMRIIQSYLGDNLQQITNRTADEIKTIVNENAVKYAEKKLILHEAAVEGVTVSEGEIDTVMKDEYRKWGGEENYRQSLISRQLSYEYIVNDLSDGLKVNKYFHRFVKPNIEVEEEQIRNRFENYYATVRHIVLSPGDASADEIFEVRQKLEGIRERALSGEDFASLAQMYSDDDRTKKQGGLVKNLAHGIMPRAFEQAAFTVPVGDISDIFETAQGFHILKVEERKPHSDSFEKAIPIIREQLIKERQEIYYQNHVMGLREKADYREFLL